jgi:hypothetical protein
MPAPLDELDALCKTRLAGYKRPRRYEVLEALPRNASDKVQRNLLRARCINTSPCTAVSSHQGPRGPMTPTQLIDGRPLTLLQVRVIVLSAAVVFLDGYDLQVLALAIPSLSSGWNLKPAGFGMALAASMLGIGIGSVFVAPWGDRWTIIITKGGEAQILHGIRRKLARQIFLRKSDLGRSLEALAS